MNEFREHLKTLPQRQLELQLQWSESLNPRNEKDIRMIKEEMFKRQYKFGVDDFIDFEGVKWRIFKLLPLPVLVAPKENVIEMRRAPALIAWINGLSSSPFELKPKESSFLKLFT